MMIVNYLVQLGAGLKLLGGKAVGRALPDGAGAGQFNSTLGDKDEQSMGYTLDWVKCRPYRPGTRQHSSC